MNYHGRTRDVMTLAHELGPRRASGARRRAGLLHVRHAAHACRNRVGVRRDADLPRPARRRDRACAPAHHARRQGRGHAEHGGPPGRVLPVRAACACRAAHRRAAARADRRDLAGGAAREPRPGLRVQPGIRRVLGLRAALHPHAVLRLRLCLRRLPGERALLGVPGRPSRFSEEIPGDAGRRRHKPAPRAAGAVRAGTRRILGSGSAVWTSSPASSTSWSRAEWRSSRSARSARGRCSARCGGSPAPPARWAASRRALPGSGCSASRPTRRRMRRTSSRSWAG